MFAFHTIGVRAARRLVFGLSLLAAWQAPAMSAVAVHPAATAATTMPAVVRAHPRDLLAHGGPDALWVADVERVRASATTTEMSDQTQVFARANRPRQPWRLIQTIPGRATAMADRDGQLAVLLSDGTWLAVWADGSASGQPLPAGGRLLLLADDGQSLWGLGSVAGGMAAADADLARRAATQPTSMAAARPPAAATTRGTASLVVFRQDRGQWTTVAQVPADPALAEAADDNGLAMAVVNGIPTLAYATAGGTAVRVLGWSGPRGWQPVGPSTATTRPSAVAGFALLAGPTGPMVWTTGGADAGRLDGRPLAWPAGQARVTGPPVVATAGGYLRVIAPVGEQVMEQRYDPRTGEPVGTPAEVTPPEPHSPPASLWVEGLLLASLMFTVGTSVYRQPASAPAGGGPDGAASDGPAAVIPAPYGKRAAAGAIDLLPLATSALAVLITAVATSAAGEPGSMSGTTVWLLAVGVGLYLAHTTVLEAMTARSAGKWIMGLRVATPDGGRPALWQLVARNLLRVVDPLVQMAISPLRQRTADVLAGTVVVSVAPPPVTPPTSSGDGHA